MTNRELADYLTTLSKTELANVVALARLKTVTELQALLQQCPKSNKAAKQAIEASMAMREAADNDAARQAKGK